MDYSYFDNHLATAARRGAAKRDKGLSELGKATLAQVRRMARGAISTPSKVGFAGSGTSQYGILLDRFEITNEDGDTYVETFEEQGPLWLAAQSYWEAVAELATLRFGLQHTFTIDLEDGVVEFGREAMFLENPALADQDRVRKPV